MKTFSFVLGFLFCCYVTPLQAQGQADCTIGYEMKRVLPAHSIPTARLLSARSISELVKHFEQSWVKHYHSVSLKTTVDGQVISAIGASHRLTEEQVSLLQTADIGTNVELEVTYIPDNRLEHNDLHTLHYDIGTTPEVDAQFAGGVEEYLVSQGISDVIYSTLDPCDLVAVMFVINSEGLVTDVELSHSQFYTVKYEKLENQLMAAICAMPRWNPAKHRNNASTSQKQVLMVGNQQSCITNFFTISEEWN